MKLLRSSKTIIALAALLSLSPLTQVSAEPERKASAGEPNGKVEAKMTKGVACEIHINAPNSRVWQAIHEEREEAPGIAYSRVVVQDANHLQVEQKYHAIPMLGAKSCMLDMKESPIRKIEFASMLGDVKISGEWTLEPLNDGKETSLKLWICSNSRLAHLVVKPFTKIWISRRLADVKRFAEQQEDLNVHGRVVSLL